MNHSRQASIVIVVPVYNDWTSFHVLASQINSLYDKNDVLILVVDDGSEVAEHEAEKLESNIHRVHLIRNLGHQKAISIGIAFAVDNFKFANLIVMDGDGEDRPSDIQRLIDASTLAPDKIIFARRTKRKEGPIFKLFYSLYRRIFKLLTGISISFGNFCLMPVRIAHKVTYVSEIWNHFSGGVVKSKLPYQLLPIERGSRISGESKMNFTSLILHGLGSLSVHIDTVSVRVLIASIVLLAVSLVAILVIVAIRVFTDLAIPGWTSNMVIGLTLIFLQSIFFSFVLVFVILSHRTQKHFIPAKDYKMFIQNIQ
jgi:glycosyltransferase involved in cell wall biosynthesis